MYPYWLYKDPGCLSAGCGARLFGIFSCPQYQCHVDYKGSSESSISFAVRPEDAGKAKEAAEATFARDIEANTVDPLTVENNLSVVALIGENMRYTGISGRMFRALGKNGINVVAIAQGSSEQTFQRWSIGRTKQKHWMHCTKDCSYPISKYLTCLW